MSTQPRFKKIDRVWVSTLIGDFTDQVGTVIAVSRWVFGKPKTSATSWIWTKGIVLPAMQKIWRQKMMSR